MRTSLEQHLGSRQVGRVVYGSIIGMALVVTLDSHPPTASVMTLWLLGPRSRSGSPRSTARSWVWSQHPEAGPPVAAAPDVRGRRGGRSGVSFPAVFFLLAALGVLSLRHGVHGREVVRHRPDRLLPGYRAARFSGATRGRALVKAAMVALVGLGLIALKAVVH